MQFLLEGARLGEKGLYITLSETEQELRDTAASHGWALPDDVEIFELVPPESLLDERQQQSLSYSSDLELGETTKRIFESMAASKLLRVVLDSLSEIRIAAIPESFGCNDISYGFVQTAHAGLGVPRMGLAFVQGFELAARVEDQRIIKKPFVGDELAEKVNAALHKPPRSGNRVVVSLRR